LNAGSNGLVRNARPLSALRLEVSLFDLIAGSRNFAGCDVFGGSLNFTEEFVCGAKGTAD
jgi:hypothetical protein